MTPRTQNPQETRRPNSFEFGFRVSFGIWVSSFGLGLSVACLLLFATALCLASDSEPFFSEGLGLYRAGDYPQAADIFRKAAVARPSSGTLQNLGLAEWHCGHTGPAVLAWEQALWLNPFNEATRMNLRFVRKTAQLESPELTWYEVVSTWLPVNWWAWTASFSLWLAIGIGAVPGLLRWRKAAWQQAIAAIALTVFLLSLPAQLGLGTRSCLGFIQRKDVPLRLTPTQQAQYITRLAAGEPARLERSRGGYSLIHTSRSVGWVKREDFRLICAAE